MSEMPRRVVVGSPPATVVPAMTSVALVPGHCGKCGTQVYKAKIVTKSGETGRNRSSSAESVDWSPVRRNCFVGNLGADGQIVRFPARDSRCQSPAGTGAPNLVAIDSKIEQAMDLVKTHLMYAVREEVELLRTKIAELEKKVLFLEAENAFLREHVGPEILKHCPTQQAPPGLIGVAATTLAAQISAVAQQNTAAPLVPPRDPPANPPQTAPATTGQSQVGGL